MLALRETQELVYKATQDLTHLHQPKEKDLTQMKINKIIGKMLKARIEKDLVQISQEKLSLEILLVLSLLQS